ncbi:Zinc finger, TFIIB-type domain protein [Sulfolobales Virus YNP2]|uniref:Zinc finger, TFIIB-type domain protein n=1 Tax=Sulfolobales Virus YNP2 TaxID=1732180 RepID=UPI00070652F7|nr:Zinc finger, TFIIB-type domain protein [Sulfolobales Virus YNP2]ALG97213.1 Zinc finger, TFIIB-type domain protein [Sulfolobales Virus YNP2]
MIVFDAERGELIDTETGEVIEERVVDPGPEWRTFSDTDRLERERVGSRLSLKVHDQGLTTKIGKIGYRNVEDKIKLIKMRRLQNSVRVSYKDKKLVTYLSRLNAEASKLGLPEHVKETAAIIVKKLFRDESYMRIKPDALIAVVLYYASQINNIPLSLQELKARFDLSERAVWKALKRINEVVPYFKPKVNTPTKYIPIILNKLNLPLTVETKVVEIVEQMQKRGLTSGKSRLAFGAAAVYIASKLMDINKTQKEIAETLNISELVLRMRYKEILNILGPIRYKCKNCGFELYRFERVGQEVFGIKLPSEVKAMYGGKCPRCGHELGEPSLVPGKLEVAL